MTYEMVGDYPAPSFFMVDPESGEIKIRNSLKGDSLKLSTYAVCNGLTK